MKRTVLIFGAIAGAIVSTFMAIIIATGCDDSASGYVIGYSSMIIAFAFLFVGVKSYRDRYNQGVITFGKAFLVGLYITLVVSTIYVIAWMIDYHYFIPDFMDKYSAVMIDKARHSGVTQVVLDKKIAEINSMKEMYKNPIFVALITYTEILPVGIVIALITALILRRNRLKPQPAVA